MKVAACFRVELEERKREGIAKYGTCLQPFNGRDAAHDLYQEQIDAVQYAKQLCVENPDVKEWETLYWKAVAYLMDLRAFIVSMAPKHA